MGGAGCPVSGAGVIFGNAAKIGAVAVKFAETERELFRKRRIKENNKELEHAIDRKFRPSYSVTFV